MFNWIKKFKKKKKLSSMMKAMLKPVLLPLVAVLDATLEGWKLVVLAKLELVDPKKFIGVFTDSVDELRVNIKEQIEKVLAE